MASYVAWYMAYCMARYMAYYMAWYRCAYRARLWGTVGACGVWMARLRRAGCGSAMAYGWRLWRMVGACGVQGADRVDGLQREAVVPMCRPCVVPMCRHGCAYMPTWLRLYADMVAWLWRERVRLDGVSV